jgi:hypothetical protein
MHLQQVVYLPGYTTHVYVHTCMYVLGTYVCRETETSLTRYIPKPSASTPPSSPSPHRKKKKTNLPTVISLPVCWGAVARASTTAQGARRSSAVCPNLRTHDDVDSFLRAPCSVRRGATVACPVCSPASCGQRCFPADGAILVHALHLS